MARNKALYNISLKIFLERDGEFLILTNEENKFDLPGGRIDEDEHRKSLKDIIHREIIEELGEGFRFEIGKPIMHFRRIFDEDGLYVFILVFSGKVLSNDIIISEEHNGYFWMKPEEIIMDPDKFYSEEEYAAFSEYIDKLSNR